MKMISNKKWIILTMIILVISFGSYITYRVIKDYRYKVYLVAEKRILEAAKKCIDENKCKEFPVLLRDLYENQYLKEESNPLTKEVYNYDSYIDNKDGKLVFNSLY